MVGVFCIRGAEHATKDHASVARGACAQAMKLELECLLDDLEVENKAPKSSGDVLQSTAVQRHAVELTTGEILRRHEDDPARVDEGQTARDCGLYREHRARVFPDAPFVDGVFCEADADVRFLCDRAARVRHDDIGPQRILGRRIDGSRLVAFASSDGSGCGDEEPNEETAAKFHGDPLSGNVLGFRIS